ncbi:TetR/AcrR family transcriptional regulator [Nocardia sp. NPDC059239]|uniref:TetR/AcrR family transcriptional regulator n=1 Tax=unclassified Nocardia TaxID=2637762 RepID=UPI0036A163F6
MPPTSATDSSKSRRVRMDGEERRRQIIEIAQRLFSQRPYSEVSTAEIADAVGIGRPNLHYHFRTKRDLYVEVVRNFARLPPPPRVHKRRGTLEDKIRHTLDGWLDVVWENRGTFMTIFEAGPINNDREIEDILEDGREAWAARMAELLELPGGATRPARAIIRSFQSMAETAVDEWLRRDRLTRDDVLLLLTKALLALAQDVAPSVLNPASTGRAK